MYTLKQVSDAINIVSTDAGALSKQVLSTLKLMKQLEETKFVVRAKALEKRMTKKLEEKNND